MWDDYHRQQLAEVEDADDDWDDDWDEDDEEGVESSSTNVNLVAGWRLRLSGLYKNQRAHHLRPVLLYVRCRPDKDALAPPSGNNNTLKIILSSWPQSTLEAYQRNTSITLIGRWSRSRTNTYKCHPLPCAVVIKPARLYTRPAVTRFSS